MPKVIIHSLGRENKATVIVNGVKREFPCDKPIEISDEHLEAVKNSRFDVTEACDLILDSRVLNVCVINDHDVFLNQCAVLLDLYLCRLNRQPLAQAWGALFDLFLSRLTAVGIASSHQLAVAGVRSGSGVHCQHGGANCVFGTGHFISFAPDAGGDPICEPHPCGSAFAHPAGL